MKVPTNPAAEQVDRLFRENVDLDTSIQALTEKRTANTSIIDALVPIATWEDVPDPIPDPVADPAAAVTDALPEGEV